MLILLQSLLLYIVKATISFSIGLPWPSIIFLFAICECELKYATTAVLNRANGLGPLNEDALLPGGIADAPGELDFCSWSCLLCQSLANCLADGSSFLTGARTGTGTGRCCTGDNGIDGCVGARADLSSDSVIVKN